MFVVEQQDPIKIAVELGERELAQVRVGQPAEVEIAGMAGAQRRAGTVEAVIPAVDPGTRTFQVQVVVPNPDRAIGTGAFARVRFAGRGRPALLVPASALVRQGQLEGVYVVSHGRALLRWVRVGAARGEQAEVLSGLEAGDLVVVEPRPDLRDGSAVEVGGDA
jgi:RND family efflux transporter MFP subunit